MSAPTTEPSMRRRRAAPDHPHENGSTLYSLAESTRLAWERVRRLYATDPQARSYSFADVRRGYNIWDPFSSKRIVGAVCLILLTALLPDAYSKREQIVVLADNVLRANFWELIVILTIIAVLGLAYGVRKPRPVYLLDFETFQPPERYYVSVDRFMETTLAPKKFDEESANFQKKVLSRSGIGNKSAFPSSILDHCHSIPENNGDERAAIDLLVLNCSLFNPTPSLSAMLVNKYKMRSSVRTYNLAGMGCSAGLIALDLAKDLLQVHRKALCVVVSTENITQNWYLGKERSMLITNTLFRMGASAVLLSNNPANRSRARYVLKHTVRTHVGADDLAYDSIFQMEDKCGIRGVKLSKNIMDVAGGALKKNVTTLAPLVFPLTEHIKFAFHLLRKKVLHVPNLHPYIPDFHRAFDHFCIHTGGRAVIDVMQDALKLTDHDIQPSRYTLNRYGNTSSASVWYELKFVENDGRMRRGHRIWQIAFGSGFKCNSAVWECLQDVPGNPEAIDEESLRAPVFVFQVFPDKTKTATIGTLFELQRFKCCNDRMASEYRPSLSDPLLRLYCAVDRGFLRFRDNVLTGK
ncbi:3-ketoacyl-CoA synthase [Chondrus crispus]|uniref:very-long-chain 3-oxoacyl-CoA synthase n=1 Tax=Chondrus crispus TaxID=2769 RepID=R7QGN5_CHOCR|nr:3-ketoacyl-CoA synthase [Chondrus crispus]CDF37249.1 3-ketoacyl-CoA synthase [Chondrus crispus]|eukprot:XP_005717068.1 3-ketoacyl-CoA synthase [Chondrus crispus]